MVGRENGRYELFSISVFHRIVIPVNSLCILNLLLVTTPPSIITVLFVSELTWSCLHIPCVTTEQLLPVHFQETIVETEAWFQRAKRLKEVQTVHYLHPLDQVVSVEKMEVLDYLKVLLCSLFVRNVYALVNHRIL